MLADTVLPGWEMRTYATYATTAKMSVAPTTVAKALAFAFGERLVSETNVKDISMKTGIA
jgi:hypothetical protein